MLDNTITLPVDKLNNGTTVNQVYSRDEEYVNRSVYTGPEHSLVKRQTLGFYRTPIKKSGTSLGTAKSAMKLTEDITVLNSLGANTVAPAIIDIAVSFPVGITVTVAMELRQRAIAVLDHAVAAFVTEKLSI